MFLWEEDLLWMKEFISLRLLLEQVNELKNSLMIYIQSNQVQHYLFSIIWSFDHVLLCLDCLSAVDMVEFNPAIGTEEEVTRTAMNAMKRIQILLGEKSHLMEAPLPPDNESIADVVNWSDTSGVI